MLATDNTNTIHNTKDAGDTRNQWYRASRCPNSSGIRVCTKYANSKTRSSGYNNPNKHRNNDHGLAILDFGVRKAIAPAQTITVTFTPDKKGSFRYFCNVSCGSGHQSMVETLIVE